MAAFLDDLMSGLNSDQGLLGLAMMAAAAPKERRTTIPEGLLSGMSLVNQRRLQREEQAMRQAEMRMREQDFGLRQRMSGLQEQQIMQALDAQKAQQEKQQQLTALMQGVLSKQSAPSQYGLAGNGVSMGGVSERMVPQRGGIEGADLNTVTMLHALGGPNLLDAWKIGQSGVEQKPGTFYVKNGQREYTPNVEKGITMDGGRISLIPGALEAQAALAGATKGAEARATASMDPFVAVGPDGSQVVIGTRESVADQTRPRPQPLVEDRVRKLMSTFGDTAANYDIGGQRGSIGASSGGIKVGQSPREKASAEALVMGNQVFMKDRFPSVQADGDAAGNSLAAITTARNGLAQMGRSGWGTEMIGGAANVLASLGVPQAERFATGMQQFQSAAMDRLWTTLNAAKGPQTEGDVDRASKTFARLANTQRANEYILDLAQAKAERDQMRARYFQEALPLAQQSGDLQEIERRWARVMPSIFSMPSMKRWAQ